MGHNHNKLIVKTTSNQSYTTVSSDLFKITIEIEGKNSSPSKTSNFALWLSLPIAMAAGRDLYIDGIVSAAALYNARKLAAIWFKWHPTLYSQITVDASETVSSMGINNQKPNLMLYSGGVDSTYSLLKNYLNTQTPVSLLTIHGMDYKTDDIERFNKLKRKIEPLTSQIHGNHYFIRSNAPEVMNSFGIDGGIGHGFQLFGLLFLFESDYAAGAIAADCTPALDFIISPWGTNHLTNQLFSSEQFFIKTLDSDVDRAEKTGLLMNLDGSERALTALTFCKDRQSRPYNCGSCSKCLRTKAMFYTESGVVPDIFSNRSFKPVDLKQINLSDRGERALVLDILASANRNGRLEEFRWLEERVKIKPKPGPRSPVRIMLKAMDTAPLVRPSATETQSLPLSGGCNLLVIAVSLISMAYPGKVGRSQFAAPVADVIKRSERLDLKLRFINNRALIMIMQSCSPVLDFSLPQH